MSALSDFSILEASIDDHRRALDSHRTTSVELVIGYLVRIATYDTRGGLNAFTVVNPRVLDEAAASDARRAAGTPPRRLEGIPYTLKDSFKYEGLTVTNGSPALAGLQSSEDSYMAARFREAGAVLLGKTNMPPMAAGGMQRGLYGRAESPYNPEYLTAAYSSGSSNGAATSLAASMAAFGMGSETVSSGRSAASNNALCAYTPSRGILSCRGLWPLYVTCDVPVPYARSMADMLEILAVIAAPDPETREDFWRSQTHVSLPQPPTVNYPTLARPNALASKRIGVPKMYTGQSDSSPHAKPTTIHPSVLTLWQTAARDLTALGAELIPTDFPLVTNYENDSVSGEANNVVGTPSTWNAVERSTLIAKAWDEFLIANNDPQIPSLTAVDANLLFPKPDGYIPDTFLEVRNWIDYPGLPSLAASIKDTSIFDTPGLRQALASLEAQRKRDLEDWMDTLGLDCIAFPANGDVGFADLEYSLERARHSLQNGVRYSNGNRAIRHLGVPTVSVPMGVMQGRDMPVNVTFAGRAYGDEALLGFAFAYERGSRRRVRPPLTPGLGTDEPVTTRDNGGLRDGRLGLDVAGMAATNAVADGVVECSLEGTVTSGGKGDVKIEVYLDGSKSWEQMVCDGAKWHAVVQHKKHGAVSLGWDLKPLPEKPIMVLVVARADFAPTVAKLEFASISSTQS